MEVEVVLVYGMGVVGGFASSWLISLSVETARSHAPVDCLFGRQVEVIGGCCGCCGCRLMLHLGTHSVVLSIIEIELWSLYATSGRPIR